MTGPVDREKLESQVSQVLRGLPPRRAPATLELRVHDELRRRMALPWWRHRFARWPLAMRCLFVLTSAAAMGLTLWGPAWPLDRLSVLTERTDKALAWAHPVVTVAGSAHEWADRLAGLVPTPWLYIGLSLGALSYTLLFGLGAAAYRTLYLEPSNGR